MFRWGGDSSDCSTILHMLLLNHKLYKIDCFLHLCQCGDCLRGRTGLASSDSITTPLQTRTRTHSHALYLHLIFLQPEAKETVWEV